jgi:hypothetical protein
MSSRKHARDTDSSQDGAAVALPREGAAVALPRDGAAVARENIDDALAVIFGEVGDRGASKTTAQATATGEAETAAEDEPAPRRATAAPSLGSATDAPSLDEPAPSLDETEDEAAFSPAVDEEPRRWPVWQLVVTACIVFIVTTGALTFFLRHTMAQQAAEQAAIKAEGDAYLNEAISLIQEADVVVIALDTASKNQVTEEALPQLEVLLDQCPSTQTTLDGAIDKAQLAQDTYTTDEDHQLAQHAIDAAEARKDMLNLSSRLTSYDIAAMQCAVEFSQAWDLLVAADGDMRSAVEIADDGGREAVSEAVGYNQAALDKLMQAEDALGRAGALFAEADFTSVIDYLTAKKASVELAIASDEAVLNDDIAEARRLNDEFVVKDTEVVELAQQIPTEPMSLIVSTYDTATGPLRTSYQEARDRAADADAFLRVYVGVDVQ